MLDEEKASLTSRTEDDDDDDDDDDEDEDDCFVRPFLLS
jgi:hypothetical protein